MLKGTKQSSASLKKIHTKLSHKLHTTEFDPLNHNEKQRLVKRNTLYSKQRKITTKSTHRQHNNSSNNNYYKERQKETNQQHHNIFKIFENLWDINLIGSDVGFMK